MIRHTCDNRKCINPDHLVAGTQGQNLCDRKDHGHRYRKLTQVDADNIKAGWAQRCTMTALAKWYNVSIAMVSHILHGRQWA